MYVSLMAIFIIFKVNQVKQTIFNGLYFVSSYICFCSLHTNMKAARYF